MRVACVTFDIDDTLYLERDYVQSGFAAVGKWLEERRICERFEQEAWTEFETGIRGDTFDRTLLRLGVEPRKALIRAMVHVYRTHIPNISLLPDAAEALDALSGVARLAVVSDGPEASQQAKVKALSLDDWCEPIVLTASLGPSLGKPHALAFEIVQEYASCNGGACVYVADNPLKDFQGPKKLGWRTIRVKREGGLHSSIPSGRDVDVELHDTKLILSLVREPT